MVDLANIKSYLNFSLSDSSGSGIIINDNFYFYDDITGGAFNNSTNSLLLKNPSVGLKLEQNQYFYNNYFQFPSQFNMSFGFWLTSVYPGMIQEDYDSDLESLRMSVLGFSIFDAPLYVAAPYMYICEATRDKAYNVLELHFMDDNNHAIVTTGEYESNKRHYFWIDVVDAETGSINVYVDGVLQATTTIGDFPSIPSTLRSTCEYSINKNLLPSRYVVNGHYGYINEIFIMSTNPSDSIGVMQDLISGGINQVTGSSVKKPYCLIYDDVETKKVNVALSEKNSFYLGLNNGNLMQSSLSIWDSRSDFTTITADELGDMFEFGPDSTYSLSDGFLTLNQGSLIDL